MSARENAETIADHAESLRRERVEACRADAERGTVLARVALGAYLGAEWAQQWPEPYRQTALSAYGLA